MCFRDELYDAIVDGDCNLIDALLRGRDPNLRSDDSDRWNLLHIALLTLSGDPNSKVVSHLIELGVDVNARDGRQWTPLHFAARTRDPVVVRLLIQAGADVNAKDREGVSPLNVGLFRNPINLEAIELLISSGAKMDVLRKYVGVVITPFKRELCDLLMKYSEQDWGHSRFRQLSRP